MPWTWLIESELLLYLLAPVFIVIAKSRKWLGYVLLAVMTLISILFSVFLLDHKDISFFPAVLFNNSDEYVLQFQMNALVQSAPFAIGMLFGVLFVNALDKMEGENTVEIRLGNLVKKGGAVTLLMQLIGLVLMNVAFWLIVPTIDNPKSSFTRFFLSTTPTMFALGLGLLITPSVLGGSSRLTNFLNSFLGIFVCNCRRQLLATPGPHGPHHLPDRPGRHRRHDVLAADQPLLLLRGRFPASDRRHDLDSCALFAAYVDPRNDVCGGAEGN